MSQTELDDQKVFIRYVCHEMRSPLNTTMLGLQYMEERLSRRWSQMQHILCKDEMLSVARDARVACSAAVETLDDMLTSDKIRSGLLQMDRREVKLLTLLDAVVQSLQAQVGVCSYLSLLEDCLCKLYLLCVHN